MQTTYATMGVHSQDGVKTCPQKLINDVIGHCLIILYLGRPIDYLGFNSVLVFIYVSVKHNRPTLFSCIWNALC